MIILDTDIFSFFELRDTVEHARVRSRIAQLDPPEIIATTVVTYEEQSRGRLAKLTKAVTPNEILEAYFHLRKHIANYHRVVIMVFDALALAEYDQLISTGYRIGTLDLRIAAIAISQNATLISRNLIHFRKIAALRVEDWTAP